MPPSPVDDHRSDPPAGLGLTERQAAVLALLMRGKSNKAIGRELNLAAPTVKNHVTAILRALKVASRTQAVLKVSSLNWKSTPGSGDAAAMPPPAVPDEPSIVVLPFANLSGDVSQAYFANGMVCEITIALGRIPRLFVISSSSAFAYEGRATDVRQIGRELGVRYILGGNVRRNANQVRIVVELSDATLGTQIRGERFEGTPDKVFELQDSVAASVSAMIAPALRSVEAARACRKPTANLTAYDLYLRALPPHRDTHAQNQESLRLLYKAIELDPAFGAAYALAAYCHLMQVFFCWQVPPPHWIAEGVRLAQLAAERGDDDPDALWMAGRTLAALAGDSERGLALIGRSLALNPNSARAWWVKGLTHAHRGEAGIALEDFARARRLNPRDTSEHGHWTGIALAHLFSGACAPAKESIDKALIDWPASPGALRIKAAVCGLLGLVEEGGECVQRLLALNPDTTVATVRALNHSQMQGNPHGFAAFLDGLRASGLPEE